MSTPEQCKANRERKKREREQLKRDLGLTVVSQGPIDIVEESLTGSDAPDWAKTKAEREAEGYEANMKAALRAGAGKAAPLTIKERCEAFEIPREPIGKAIEIAIPKRRNLRKIGKAAKKTVAKSKAAKKKGLTSRQVRASKTLVSNRPRPGSKPETIARNAQRKAAAKEIRQAKTPRTDTRKATIYAMLTSRRGATQTEIMLATGWQAHTLRGFLSTRASKDGWKIISTKNEEGERHYKIAAEQQA